MSVKKFVTGNFYDEAVLFPAVKKYAGPGIRSMMCLHRFLFMDWIKPWVFVIPAFIQRGLFMPSPEHARRWAFITWALTVDWQLNFGGKPFFALPAWIPITFELTVLFASVGMVLTFCYLCQMAPFVKKDHFNLRSTDDTFVMALECTDKTNEADAVNFLQSLGASEVQVQYKETGWWLGRYDKDTKRFEKKKRRRQLISLDMGWNLLFGILIKN